MSGVSFPRRWFVGLAALFALVGRSAHARSLVAPAPTTAPELGAALLELLPARADAAVLGRAYLAANPAEADLDRLVRQLTAMAREPSDLQAAIGDRLRRDFANRDTVRLDGWVLARTEARLCAVCALLHDGASA